MIDKELVSSLSFLNHQSSPISKLHLEFQELETESRAEKQQLWQANKVKEVVLTKIWIANENT